MAATIARYSNNHPEDFDAVRTGLAKARGARPGAEISRADIEFAVEHADISQSAWGFVTGGFISHFDRDGNGSISKAEWAAGSANPGLKSPNARGVGLRHKATATKTDAQRRE